MDFVMEFLNAADNRPRPQISHNTLFLNEKIPASACLASISSR